MRALVWFRGDLRVRDNPALHEACSAATRGVVGVFVACPRQWHDAHEWGMPKADFVLRSVAALSEELKGREIALRVVVEDWFEGVPGALLSVAREHECDAVYFNNEYELNERRRDEAVEGVFEDEGLGVRRFHDLAVYPPGSVRTGEGRVYTVFSPFKRACKARWKDGDQPETLPIARAQNEMVGRADPVPTGADLGVFDAEAPGVRADLWKAGEAHAGSRLRAFVEGRLREYRDRRDAFALNGTSTLSPYLAAGVVSVRQCLHAALDANQGRVDSGEKGAVTWIDELLWRDFYKHLTAAMPRLSRGENMKAEYDRVAWRDAEGDLAAWREARTGYPIVDAAMRQLHQTGWMHNRLRMVVAMFLTKHLLIHWRRGEEHFCRTLVDLDYASNNGGWQWSASTGADAAPYFRIMNPISQSRRYDPEGRFLRKFLPELSTLDDTDLHAPWESARAPEAYPGPIVDHAAARARALGAFKAD